MEQFIQRTNLIYLLSSCVAAAVLASCPQTYKVARETTCSLTHWLVALNTRPKVM